MLLLERRNDGYKSPGGKARPDGDVLKYVVALASGALLVLLLRNCPQPAAHEPSCRRWSCTTPLVDNVLGRWPSPRDNLGPRDNLDAAARTRWRAVHDEQMAAARAAAASARVAFIGDSITEGWIRTGFSASQPSVAQPEAEAIWRASFGKYHAVNLGIGGDRVQDLGWRVQQGLLAPLKQVRVVVMLIGTNDLGNGETADVALAELKVLLQQVHAALPAARILTMAVFPRGGDEGVPRTPSFHRSGWWSAAANNHHPSIHTINRGLEQFAAAAPYATFVDCNSAFVRRAANTHNTYIPVEIMYDLLHLTAQGYKAWASCLLPELARVPGLEGRGACAGRSCRGDPADDAAGVDLA